MEEKRAPSSANRIPLAEVRYSLQTLIQEVQEEREGSSIGQEIVDQVEISKLFKRKKKARSGKEGK